MGTATFAPHENCLGGRGSQSERNFVQYYRVICCYKVCYKPFPETIQIFQNLQTNHSFPAEQDRAVSGKHCFTYIITWTWTWLVLSKKPVSPLILSSFGPLKTNPHQTHRSLHWGIEKYLLLLFPQNFTGSKLALLLHINFQAELASLSCASKWNRE